MKLLATILTLLTISCLEIVRAATITGNTMDIVGEVVNAPLVFTPLKVAAGNAGTVAAGSSRSVTPTLGEFSINLQGGLYNVRFQNAQYHVLVPPFDTNTYSFKVVQGFAAHMKLIEFPGIPDIPLTISNTVIFFLTSDAAQTNLPFVLVLNGQSTNQKLTNSIQYYSSGTWPNSSPATNREPYFVGNMQTGFHWLWPLSNSVLLDLINLEPKAVNGNEWVMYIAQQAGLFNLGAWAIRVAHTNGDPRLTFASVDHVLDEIFWTWTLHSNNITWRPTSLNTNRTVLFVTATNVFGYGSVDTTNIFYGQKMIVDPPLVISNSLSLENNQNFQFRKTAGPYQSVILLESGTDEILLGQYGETASIVAQQKFIPFAGLQFSSDAGSGKVFTSDGSGNATWKSMNNKQFQLANNTHSIKSGAIFTNIYVHVPSDNMGLYFSDDELNFNNKYGFNLTPSNRKMNIMSKGPISLSCNADQIAGTLLQLGNTGGGYDIVNIQRNGSPDVTTNRPSKVLTFGAHRWGSGSDEEPRDIAMQHIVDAGADADSRLWISKPLNHLNQVWSSGILARTDTIGQINSRGSGWSNLEATNFMGVGSAAGTGAANIESPGTGIPFLDVASGTYPGILLGGVVTTGARTDAQPKVGVLSFPPYNIADNPVTGFYYDRTGGYYPAGNANALMIGGGLTSKLGMNTIQFFCTQTVDANSTGVPVVAIDHNYTSVKTGAGTAVAASYARVGGILDTSTAIVGNVGGGEDILYTTTIPANTLGQDGDQIEFDFAGILTTVHVKRLEIFLGTSIFTPGTTTCSSGAWRMTGRIIRTASNTFTAVYQAEQCGTWLTTVNSGSSQDFTTALTFKVTGEDEDGTPSNDAVQIKMACVKWYPAN